MHRQVCFEQKSITYRISFESSLRKMLTILIWAGVSLVKYGFLMLQSDKTVYKHHLVLGKQCIYMMSWHNC